MLLGYEYLCRHSFVDAAIPGISLRENIASKGKKEGNGSLCKEILQNSYLNGVQEQSEEKKIKKEREREREREGWGSRRKDTRENRNKI